MSVLWWCIIQACAIQRSIYVALTRVCSAKQHFLLCGHNH